MPPVVALNLSNGRDVAGAERGGAVREDNEQEAEDQEHGAPAHSKFCHVVAGDVSRTARYNSEVVQ